MKLKNKKADISITLLVVMTFALCGAALFSFSMYNPSVQKSVTDFKSLGSIYDLDRNFEFYIYHIAKISVNNGDESSFVTNFIANYSSYNQTQSFYPEYMEQIKNLSKYDINIMDGVLYFRLKDFELNSDLSKNTNSKIRFISWRKDISFEIEL